MIIQVGVLLMVLVTAMAARASSERIETQTYLGPSLGPNVSCQTISLNVGSACFRVLKTDSFVTLSVIDDHRADPVGGWYRFVRRVGFSSPYFAFCGTVTDVPVEKPIDDFLDRVTLEVSLDVAYAAPVCSKPSVPISGTIQAAFR